MLKVGKFKEGFKKGAFKKMQGAGKELGALTEVISKEAGDGG